MNSIYAIFFDPKNYPWLIAYLNKNYEPIYIKDTKYDREEYIEYSNNGRTVDWHNLKGDSYRFIYDNQNRLVYKRTVFSSGTKFKKVDIHDDRFAYYTEHEIVEEVYVYDNNDKLKSSNSTTTTKTFIRYEEE